MENRDETMEVNSFEISFGLLRRDKESSVFRWIFKKLLKKIEFLEKIVIFKQSA